MGVVVVFRVFRVLIAFLLVAVGLGVVPGGADATVPGGVGLIAFWSDQDNIQGEIYVRDFGGGPWTRLTNNTAYERESEWSPDGTRIAYSSDIAGSQDIWIMDADGGNKVNVTKDAPDDTQPAWSPDGTRIAYTADPTKTLESSVWAMNADGSGKVNLTPVILGVQDRNPAWSPDGTRIAFVSNRDGHPDIFLMDPDGSNVVNITNRLTNWDREPTWSPDGSQIAFMSDRVSGRFELFVMNADGTNVRQLTSDGLTKLGPAWSPDGHHIAFTSWADGDADQWMVDPDGANPGHLTDHPGGEWWVSWQPVNRAPQATDDGPIVVAAGGTVTGSVLGNDTDPDGQALTAHLVTGPGHGKVTLQPDGTFSYRNDGSAAPTDHFTYKARDVHGLQSNVATVDLRITRGPVPSMEDTVGLVDVATGEWHLRNAAGAVTSFLYGNPGDLPISGDWDGDGDATPGLYRQSDGFLYSRNSNTTGVADAECFAGDPADVPVAGDWDGDGDDNLGIYRPSTQMFYLFTTTCTGTPMGAAQIAFLFGNPGDKPVAGDWDGDGIDEVGLHRESTGFFYWRNTLTTGVADGEIFFGDPGDRFVAGDWGVVDGKDTPAVFRPSDRTFYFRHTLTQGVADSQFVWTGAGTGWLPVAGRFGLS